VNQWEEGGGDHSLIRQNGPAVNEYEFMTAARANALEACAAALVDLDDLLNFAVPVAEGRDSGWNFSDASNINLAVAAARVALQALDESVIR
jgi:hypothetical protein